MGSFGHFSWHNTKANENEAFIMIDLAVYIALLIPCVACQSIYYLEFCVALLNGPNHQ